MIAHINAEDRADGTINMQAIYINGYNEKSPAHQAIRLAMAYLDSLLTRADEPVERVHHADGRVEVVPPGEGTVPVRAPEDHARDIIMNLPEGALPQEGRS